jgi:Ca2+-binding RTX toxin-like protein
VAALTAAALVALGVTPLSAGPARGVVAPVGQGFTVTAGDLSFILKQIKIAERHANTYTASNLCGTLVGPGPNQIPDRLTSYGLRTVDGSCNNLFPTRERFASADQTFPRLTQSRFRDAEASPPGFPSASSSSYAQKKGFVYDSHPRTVSNLIVDQTSTNPAARAAAAFPVRTQNNPGLFPCTVDPAPDGTGGSPANCVPTHQTLFIPNVTTDIGLSPPYNSMFTFFGQFFDHGVDQTVKSGGTVFVPLKADDPLVTLGTDGVAGSGDEVPASQRFMVLTRAQNQPGPDKVLGDDPGTPADESADDVQDASNTDSPWVDQSQTYTSHASHQVFLRDYDLVDGKPVATGKLLGGLAPNETGMATWASVKKQAAEKLGLLLTDKDVTNIPMLATDPYGEFVGGSNGLPRYVLKDGTFLEGNLADPVPVPANAQYFDTPFLTDIAHNADPSPADLDHNPATPPQAPVKDEDTTASADFAHQKPGTYDDEMLDAHFCAGDGRVNENIALTTIHQVFHSEHDRLVADIEKTLAANPSLQVAYRNTDTAAVDPHQRTFGYGDRLFQAARFVNEMEYQHLVFEEFGRKVQPAIRPFHVYSPDMNPAVTAEFAHAVYRFGHSMLDDTVARTDPDGDDNSVPLLTAFLNPPEYFHAKNGGTLTPEEAAGSIVMGSSDQVGNELDEFVTETLRNNLLGLPLDLATLNLARARDAGVPPLNEVRRQIFAETNDGQLTPYTSWSDFGQHLKHPESLVNFVAAYGTHPSITSASTVAGKRAAARAIVDPDSDPVTDPADIPADAADFMFSNGEWSSDANGVTKTGLDQVDLWVGGLAEVTNLFGGLLGSTFNYVFQTQMESLQDGDRFYYLNRTPGMNLRTQLEGNSFSEMIQRNTEGTNSLKADVFATADCRFQLGHLSGTAAGFQQFGSTVADDPSSTDCDESRLLLRKPDGTIQYRAVNSVDPSGINGQSVYNGTAGTDRVNGGNDNDTFWGGDSRDWIEGNGGDDVALGGNGNDIITDLGGADVLKGGPGNDATDGGIGDDLFMGGNGQDFINGGANDNEAFAGPGDDFVIAGQGADAVFGDGGDDWIQGGSGQDLLIGDHSAPFFDDPAETKPGNDVFVGQVGENDYDAEGGDDLMSQNAAIDRNAGAGGFDWAIHQYDTVGADDDMEINNNLAGVPIQVVVNRDRWQEVEANSGSSFDDVVRGTNLAPSAVGGAGFTGCDVLDQAGVDRIAGLGAILPPLTGDLAPVEARSAAGVCPLSGPIWGDGDILLGGAGSDSLQGRGADDILDGDRYLAVRISVRTDPSDPASEIGSTDLMEHTYQAGNPKTLQQAVFDGTVDPGNLVVVREIKSAPRGDDVDRALFSDVRVNYAVTTVGGTGRVGSPGSTTTVRHITGTGADGVDTLRNIEKLVFADSEDPATPTNVAAVAGNQSATVTWTAPGNAPVTDFTVKAIDAAGAQVGALTVVPGSTTTVRVTSLTNGTAYRFQVRADNESGRSAYSAPSISVTPAPSAPGAPRIGTAAAGANGTATVSWTAPADDGGSAISAYSVRVVDSSGAQVGALRPAAGEATSLVVSGLSQGSVYRFQVSAANATGTGTYSALSNTVTALGPAPAVATRTPASGATGVAVGGNVTVTFDRAVTGVTTNTFRLRNLATSALVPAAVSLSTNGRTATLNPGADLANSTGYRAELVGGASAVRSLSGNVPLADQSWSFTTVADPPPTLTARSPAAGATNVNPGVNVTATFSERIQGATTTSVTLRENATGALVAATVSVNTGGNGRVITLNPNANLARNSVYRATLTGGPSSIRDLANTPFAGDTWTFRTR